MIALVIGPESRVPLVNTEDGSRLAGDMAPLRKDLDRFLELHPEYVEEKAEDGMEVSNVLGSLGQLDRDGAVWFVLTLMCCLHSAL